MAVGIFGGELKLAIGFVDQLFRLPGMTTEIVFVGLLRGPHGPVRFICKVLCLSKVRVTFITDVTVGLRLTESGKRNRQKSCE